MLIPSTRHARRTRAYKSTQYTPPPPPRLPVRATLTEGYTRSHFGPPQPDQPAASVGDYCAAVLTDVVLNILARQCQPAPPATIPTPEGLQLRHRPVADCQRYDRLREAGHGAS